MIEIKDKIVICSDNIHSEHASMEEAWQTEPTESCYVIDFETGKVWVPAIDRYNNWWGDWKLASPRETGKLLERFKDANPVKFDYGKNQTKNRKCFTQNKK